MPPLVEDRRVYGDQTDAVLSIHLTADPAAFATVNGGAVDERMQVRFVADGAASPGELGATLTVHGMTTRLAIQKSFKLELEAGAPPWRGQRTFVLNKHPYDLTRVRNRLAFECFRATPHITSARTQFARIDVNGVDLGLFTQIEYIDGDFLGAHGLDPAGALYNVQDLPFTPIDNQTAADPAALARKVTARANPDLPRLRRMLDAVNDPGRDVDEVVDRYLERDNYMTWLGMNALMGNFDTASQNFLLYGPSGHEGWYILPWDYDGAFGWTEQPGQLPRPPWQSGLANWWPVALHRRFLERAQNAVALTVIVEQLRATTLSHENIAGIVARWHDVVKPFIAASPDLENLPCDKAGTPDAIGQWEDEYARIPCTVDALHAEFVTSLARPMPVFLYEPQLGDPVVLSWQPSIALTRGPVTYDVLVSRTSNFEAGDLVLCQTGICEPLVAMKRPAAGRYHWRVVIRDARKPDDNWAQSFQDAELVVP